MKNNSFKENISNEEVAKLPIAHFDGITVVVDYPEQIEAACRDIASHRIIGFDTETRPSFKAGRINEVALLQLSTPTHCYLFRLRKVELESDINKILENKKILKIGADVRDDIKALKKLKHFREGGFVDLQTIISQWGVAEKSVRKMSGIVLGHRVSKAQRLSNWEASKLTEAQQQYAATDAWICVEIYNRLQETKKNPLTPEKPVKKKDKERDPQEVKERRGKRLFRGRRRTEKKNSGVGSQSESDKQPDPKPELLRVLPDKNIIQK